MVHPAYINKYLYTSHRSYALQRMEKLSLLTNEDTKKCLRYFIPMHSWFPALCMQQFNL